MNGKILAPRRAYAYNLLDNSDFRNPVNQRGANGTYDVWGGYTIDRWAAYAYGATVSITDTGLSLYNSVYQAISAEDMARYDGKTITYAIKINGIVYVASGIFEQTDAWHKIATANTPYGEISIEVQTDNKLFCIINNSIGTATVEWAALYEGAYTVDTLPPYVPKGYAAELAECERYFYRFDTRKLNSAAAWMMAIAWNATQARAVVHLPVIMRDIPKIEFKNIRFLQIFPESVTGLSGTFATCPVSTVKASRAFPNLYLSFTISGALAGSHGLICANDSNDAYIELSADL